MQVPSAASIQSPRAWLWDADSGYNNSLPLQTHTSYPSGAGSCLEGRRGRYSLPGPWKP